MSQFTIDWAVLERLRTAFLDGTAGRQDYWHNSADLANYDSTFGRRIGWKWTHVLNMLQRMNWRPPTGCVLDWGCGSGVASRALLAAYQPAASSKLWLWDRSPLAMQFALQKIHQEFPSVFVQNGLPSVPQINLLLLSHVLTELNRRQQENLLGIIQRANTVIWIEPGTYPASQALIRIREQLRSDFTCVAPCPHQAACGLMAPENDRHWCHHFADIPPEAFTDGIWARFAAMMQIDLHRLPLSYLVLDRRPVASLPSGATRVIGSPRLYKGFALLQGCTAAGVSEKRLSQRRHAAFFRRLKKGDNMTLQSWQCENNEIMEALFLA